MRLLARGFTLATALIGAILLTGCATGPAVTREGPAVEAPTYRVGDRWTYKAKDGFSLPVVWDEVHEVTAIGPDGITIRVTQRGPTVDNERIEKLAAPGLVRQGAVFDAETRVFPKPLVRYQFPLKPGESWHAFVEDIQQPPQPSGPYSHSISHWVSVEGWGKITTPAGSFDAVQLKIIMQLDDETPWKWPTQCSYFVWYAPAVRGIVMEEKIAWYLEKSTPSPNRIRSQNAQIELISFAPGPGPR
jgi:hypothetical protein